MPMHNFAQVQGRIAKYKGEILGHAEPYEMLGKTGRQVFMPKHNSDTYVARRWLPYGATSSTADTQNRFFQPGTGDRGIAIVQANQIAEGVTPPPDSMQAIDITVVVSQYGCLYGFTDKVYDLYEDDVPKAMLEQIGERVTLVNEMIAWGALRACTNVYYAGTGTSLSTTNGLLTLGMLRKIARNLQANHGKPVTKVLSASGDFGTDPVSEGYLVYCHTDLEPDIRTLDGFVPSEAYASGKPMQYEIGKCERFRFLTSPDLPPIQDGGAAIGSTGASSTTGTSIDVYPFVVTAQDAWGQVAVRGLNALDPTFLPPGEKSKADPLGQRGYAGTIWYKAVMIENHGWMAIGYTGSKVLV